MRSELLVGFGGGGGGGDASFFAGLGVGSEVTSGEGAGSGEAFAIASAGNSAMTSMSINLSSTCSQWPKYVMIVMKTHDHAQQYKVSRTIRSSR